MIGVIVRTHNRFYHVETDEGSFICSPKGMFKQKEKYKQNKLSKEYRVPVIGDRVELALDNKGSGVDGYIVRILERENRLIRADMDGRKERVMAANLDRILIVSAVVKPGVDFPLIDRYILTCELNQIPYCLVMNKIELDPGFGEDLALAAYLDLGIDVMLLSAKTGEGMDHLKDVTAKGISFLTGTSGVGKSTLINALVPGADLTVGEVDPRKGRGRHTTTNSTLVPLPNGGYLADSPGLRDFYPPKIQADEIRFGYREIAEIQSQCRFSTCLHDGEPGCAVEDAVDQGLISDLRYVSYLFNMREMKSFFQNRY